MIHGQTEKFLNGLPPQSVAGGATVTCEFDTLGARYLTIALLLGAVGANGLTVEKIQESDVTGSGQTDVTSGGFSAAPTGDTNKIYGWMLDLRKRKRFITVSITNGATNATLLAVVGILSRLEAAPTTAAGRGLTNQIIL